MTRKVAFDAIRGLIDLRAYVEERFEVFPERGGKLRIVCPFHGDTSPSLVIYEKTSSWFCYGCQLGGDAFDFVSRYEGLSLGEVARRYISDEHVFASWRIRLRGPQAISCIPSTYLAICRLLREYSEEDREDLCEKVDGFYESGNETELRGVLALLCSRLIDERNQNVETSS